MNYEVWFIRFSSKRNWCEIGKSVSTKILSFGMSLKVFAKLIDFLKVTTLADINAPKSSKLNANSLLPVKQCISILNFFL